MNRIPTRDIPPENWYCFKVFKTFEDGTVRLMTPRSNPHEYEYPINELFETPEQAIDFANSGDYDDEETKTWILCVDRLYACDYLDKVNAVSEALDRTSIKE